MFKIIIKNKVVHLLTDVIYLRFLASSKKFVITDATSAHAFYGPDGKTIYLLEGVALPPIDRDLLTAKLVKIAPEEFSMLEQDLAVSAVTDNYAEVLEKQAKKISELSAECERQIVAGVHVKLTDSKVHDFSLTLADQLNLMTLQQEIQNGATEVTYHENNGLLQQFDASDMRKILRAANKHKRYHTTYFNILKHHILSCKDTDIIDAIQYGTPLSDLPLSGELYKLAKENNIG